MMKKHILLMVAALAGLQPFLFAQWGDEWNVGRWSRAHLKFTEDSFTITNKPINTNFLVGLTNANICNEQGELVLVSNGSQIADSNNRVIKGGEQLLDSLMGLYFDGKDYSPPVLQGCIFLPKNKTQYYLFYQSESDSFWSSGARQSDQLHYAVIDMTGDNGKGEVISVRNTLYEGIMLMGHLTATRHGNGRDWWLINHGWENNVKQKYLVTPDTVLGPFFQAIGTDMLEPDVVGMACFSKDGSKYATGTGNSLINVLDFDRCTGEFSNPKAFKSITENPWNNPYSNGSGCNGLSFSSNNRFLYINSIYTLHQHDLLSTDISQSGVLLAKYDSTLNQSGFGLPFEAQYLAPNGKIIISNWDGGNPNFHVIEQPDSAGLACDFRKSSLFLPTVNSASSIANMINYDLGKLQGCDTFYTGIKSQDNTVVS